MNILRGFQRGFTLIELVFFIVIVGVVAAGMALPFSTLFGETHHIDEQTRAVQLAKEGMEFAIGQKRLKGFALLTTGLVMCGPTPCVVGNNTLTVTITTIDSNFKRITSIVTGSGNATLTAIVGNY
jgi:prepilin-type N-terminal cleavage/methylation domain-containing protein